VIALFEERVACLESDFSDLYLRPVDLAQDSARARHRVGALFGETVFSGHTEQLAAHLGRQLGVPVPGTGRLSSQWQQFLRDCRSADFLDTVTVVYRYLFWHLSEGIANWWRDGGETNLCGRAPRLRGR